MGILDEAIKEHLALKRRHGAAESELKQIEDEAFGASERPGAEPPPADALAEAPTQFMSQPDVEEPEAAGPEPEAASALAAEASAEAEEAPLRRRTEIADLQEPPQAEAQDEAEAETEEPEQTAGPSTEERQAIAEQPTEMYDVEEEFGDAEPEVHALSEEDEEFWDEKRLSDELDQALEAPIELQEPESGAEPETAPEPEAEAEPAEEPAEEEPPPAPPEHEDVLEDTPDFLEEAPEDDQLWFEQKPPKDFDFDD